MIFSLLGNTFVSQKFESRHFIFASPRKTLPRVLIIIRPRMREISHLQGAFFFENLFPSAEKGEEEEMCVVFRETDQICNKP